MNEKKREQQNQKKSNDKIKSLMGSGTTVTQKTEPENQNQHHNVRKEAVDAKIRQI